MNCSSIIIRQVVTNMEFKNKLNHEDSRNSQVNDAELTQKDKNVLYKIFDTEAKNPTPGINIVDKSLPPDRYVLEEKVAQFTLLEQQCLKHVNENSPIEALRILNKIIEDEPKYASAYSNRAQLLRGFTFEHNMPHDQALKDLYTALDLMLPPNSSKISELNAKILRKVYGQLAAEYMAQSKQASNKGKEWSLQLKSSEMLLNAHKYGEPIPKQSAVAFNPYAKLCGSMVDCITNLMN